MMPVGPRLWRALCLKCPYCGVEPLLEKGSWFTFRKGCPRCRYRFEREEGYYTGGSWMVNFPLTSTTIFLAAWTLMVWLPWLNGLFLAAGISVVAVALGIFIYPFSMALWMYIEHLFHPLTAEDEWQP